MNYSKRIFLLILLIAVACSFSKAQYNYTSSNKKAVAAYQSALNAFDTFDYPKATEYLEKAIKYEKNFIEAYLVLAEVNIDLNKRKEAISNYKRAIEINPDFFPGMYLSLAQLEMFEYDFESAKKYLEKYLSFKNLKPEVIALAKSRIASCDFGMWAIKNPVPFNPVNLGDSINTEYDEYWPVLTADEQTLVITRLIPVDTKKENENKEYISDEDVAPSYNPQMPNLNKVQEDFFISHRVNEFWTKAVNAGKPLNTEGNEGAQSILVDGTVMYFTACNRTGGFGRCDIYYSSKSGKEWSEPLNVGSKVNSKDWDAQPSVSSDGKTLYFVSNRAGGLGKKDIWMSVKDENGNWSEPFNLGEKINTAGDEQSPFIHPDNKTLYFSSEGKTGMGGYDLFKVSRNENGTWAEPVNLGYPINTVFDEIGLIVNAKGDKAYFASDRYSEKGRDIFEFDLYKEARPNTVSYLKGKVFDEESKIELEAHFELINLESKETIIEAKSDKESGEFLVCIPANHDYALNVSKEGYLFYSDNFSLKGVFEITNPFLKDVALKPIKIGETIILKNVFYATDSYELVDKSVVELEKLLEFLTKNPTVSIEISGHTDNVGTSEYNKILSENRAKSVYNFLVEKGIDKKRLTYIGYGEEKPIAVNDTDEGKSQNRRTEIKIIETIK